MTTTALEDEVRSAFAYRADHTEITADLSLAPRSAPARRLDLSARRPHHWHGWALVAAAVIGAGIVGAVVVQLGTANRDPKATVPADATPVIPVVPDRLAITLDAVPHAVAAAAGLSYEVLDADAMTVAGWAVTDERASATLSPGTARADGYRLQATLDSPDGVRFWLGIERDPVVSAPGPADSRVQVDGRPGWVSGESRHPTISWMRGDIRATLSAQQAELEESALVSAAAAIRFAEVHTLAASELSPGAEDQLATNDVDAAVLGGTLGGVPWAAEVDPNALRSIRVATPGGASAIGSDRLSQPTDDPAAGVELSIAGAPGHGAIAYGWAPPAANTVRAVVGGAVVGELPMYRRPGESFFAVPIPEGLVVSRLVFVDDAGAEVAARDLPLIPAGLEGNFGLG